MVHPAERAGRLVHFVRRKRRKPEGRRSFSRTVCRRRLPSGGTISHSDRAGDLPRQGRDSARSTSRSAARSFDRRHRRTHSTCREASRSQGSGVPSCQRPLHGLVRVDRVPGHPVRRCSLDLRHGHGADQGEVNDEATTDSLPTSWRPGVRVRLQHAAPVSLSRRSSRIFLTAQ